VKNENDDYFDSDLIYINQNLEGINSVNTISSNFYSQVRTRSVIEPDYIYDKNYRLNSVDPNLKMDFSRILNKPYFIKNIVWTNSVSQFSLVDVTRIPLEILPKIIS